MKLIDVKSAGEYEKVHCSPAGCATAEVRERFKETLPLAAAVPDARVNATCAEEGKTIAKSRTVRNAKRMKQAREMLITTGLLSGKNRQLQETTSLLG